jgi:hypothetical protein
MRLCSVRLIGFAVLLSAAGVNGQGTFQNLGFEQSIIVESHPSGYGFDTGMANVPGWTEYNAFGAANYPGGATMWYNNQALDAQTVSLEGVAYWTPAIDGQYSILLQGGTSYDIYSHEGASIGQTGQIPATAHSLTYWCNAGGLQVTFNGAALSFSPLASFPNYTVYATDVSAYAGQTGELLFHAPWPSGGFLIDRIEFSGQRVPEPGVLSLSVVGALILGSRVRWVMSA